MQNRHITDLPAIMEDTSHYKNVLKSKIIDLKINDVKYLHFHRDFEIGLCISGKGTLYHNGKEYPFKEGDAQIIFPYMRHMHHTAGNEPCHWIWVALDYESLLESMGFSNFSIINDLIGNSISLSGLISNETCYELYEKVFNFMTKHSKEGFSDLLHMAYEFYGILLTAADVFGKKESDSKLLGSKIASIEPALRRISDDINSGGNTSVEALSELCSMSLTGFRRIFSEIIGASPKIYIQACRIRRAKNLLKKSDMSILDIALSVGYNDISVFNRSFLKITGGTPSDYRKRHS